MLGGAQPVSLAARAAIERYGPKDGAVVVGFRPEAVLLRNDGPLAAEVYASDLHGAYTMLHLALSDGTVVHARSARELSYPIGTALRFDLDPEQVRFFDAQSERSISLQ
ncbi:hypothetical protein SE17_13535 [Kouleothrix aurantiaca]|uniref:Transport-associated OB type 2 domain-containing protein n=1 Tax=Kouleothrix aurantiaca TaxID=186479 RepID=A0A0N8PSH8_9CHLR|nr:hypothetical protein SE17_13535 [Kouleothrix aurantiaca]